MISKYLLEIRLLGWAVPKSIKMKNWCTFQNVPETEMPIFTV